MQENDTLMGRNNTREWAIHTRNSLKQAGKGRDTNIAILTSLEPYHMIIAQGVLVYPTLPVIMVNVLHHL